MNKLYRFVREGPGGYERALRYEYTSDIYSIVRDDTRAAAYDTAAARQLLRRILPAMAAGASHRLVRES